MTVEEFLAWDHGDGRIWQLVDGVPPASRRHSAVQNELGALMRNHLVEQDSRGSVVTTPGVVTPVRPGAGCA